MFDLRDPTAKSIPARKKELLRCGVQDVGFGDDSNHVLVQVRAGQTAGRGAGAGQPGAGFGAPHGQAALLPHA